MVHAPAKFRRNTAMRLLVSAKTKHDGQTDGGGGAFQYLPSRAFGAVGDN